MSKEAEAIDAALDAYRELEHTDRRDEAYANLRHVVEEVKRTARSSALDTGFVGDIQTKHADRKSRADGA